MTIRFSTANKVKAQAIFTKVLRGLRKQGKAAMFQGLCAYKNHKGLRCAIGILAGKDRKAEWEGHALEDREDNPVKTWFKTKYGSSPNLLKLGISLQNAHDHNLNVMTLSDWDEEMSGIAKNFGLKYTAPRPTSSKRKTSKRKTP